MASTSNLWLALLDHDGTEITYDGYRRARVPPVGFATIENRNLAPWTAYKWAVFDAESGGRMIREPRWIDSGHRRVDLGLSETINASLDGILGGEQMSAFFTL